MTSRATSARIPAFIDERIRELQQEWDIERTLEANAAIVALAGLGLGLTVDRRFLAVADRRRPDSCSSTRLQGWCPPLPLLRRARHRTSAEIHQEIIALGSCAAISSTASNIRKTRSPSARMWT